MKKNLLVLASGATFAAFSLFLASCGKDDDSPPAKAALSFELQEATVYEDEGTVEYKIILDKPAPEDLILEYDIDGTAVNKADVDEGDFYDYEILGEEKEIEIAEGETEAIISVKVYSDWYLEDPMTIILSLEDVDSESDLFEISGQDELEINLINEDGTLVALVWPEAEEDVDMDLIFWGKDDNDDLTPINPPFSATYKDFVPESVFYPNALELPDDTYGFSYTYHSGSSDSLVFAVIVAEFGNGEFEPEEDILSLSGLYRQVNLNTWTEDEEPSFVLAQTFEIDNFTFENFSPGDTIIAEETSSRVNLHKTFSDAKQIPATMMQRAKKSKHSPLLLDRLRMRQKFQ